jgi:hypothetical protein
MINNFREWLSIELFNLAIKICPYEEMREILKASITVAVGYVLEEEKGENQ